MDQLHRQHYWLLRTGLRLCLVGCTSATAILVPFFAEVMSLVGAMCLTMIVFFLPVVFSWLLWGDRLTLAMKVWGLVIICTGSVAGTIGTVQALQAIVEKLQSGAHQ